MGCLHPAGRASHGRGGPKQNRSYNSPQGKVRSRSSSTKIGPVGQHGDGVLGSPVSGCLTHSAHRAKSSSVMVLRSSFWLFESILAAACHKSSNGVQARDKALGR